MCERFVLDIAPAYLGQFFHLAAVPSFPPRYNIAPCQPVVAVRLDAGGFRELATLRWGLIPPWANDPRVANKLITARSETATTKPAFRHAFRARRCIIPASGYYQWRGEEQDKNPFYLHRPDDELLPLAGLWEHWIDPYGRTIETCTILTTSANADVAPLSERMPVILPHDAIAPWLAPTTELVALRNLCRPAPAATLVADPVIRAVNDPRYDAPDCLQLVE